MHRCPLPSAIWLNELTTRGIERLFYLGKKCRQQHFSHFSSFLSLECNQMHSQSHKIANWKGFATGEKEKKLNLSRSSFPWHLLVPRSPLGDLKVETCLEICGLISVRICGRGAIIGFILHIPRSIKLSLLLCAFIYLITRNLGDLRVFSFPAREFHFLCVK